MCRWFWDTDIQCCLGGSWSIAKPVSPCVVHCVHLMACHTEWPVGYHKVSNQCLLLRDLSLVLAIWCSYLKPLLLCDLREYSLLSLHLRPLFEPQFQLLEKNSFSLTCPWGPPKQILFIPCNLYILSCTVPNVPLKYVESRPAISVWFSKRYLDLHRGWIPLGVRKDFQTNSFSSFTLKLRPDTHPQPYAVFSGNVNWNEEIWAHLIPLLSLPSSISLKGFRKGSLAPCSWALPPLIVVVISLKDLGDFLPLTPMSGRLKRGNGSH